MKINIHHIAHLANLVLPKNKIKKIEKQLESTIEHVQHMNEINTDNFEPTSQVTGLENIRREDEILPSLSQGDALKNASSIYNGFFKVPAILDNS